MPLPLRPSPRFRRDGLTKSLTTKRPKRQSLAESEGPSSNPPRKRIREAPILEPKAQEDDVEFALEDGKQALK